MVFDGIYWQEPNDRFWGYEEYYYDGFYYRFGFWFFSLHWHY